MQWSTVTKSRLCPVVRPQLSVRMSQCLQIIIPLNLKTVVSACCKSFTFASTHLWSTYCVAAESNPVTHSGMLIPLALCPLMCYPHCFDTMFIPKGSTPVLLDLFIQECVLFSFPTPCPAQTCCLHTWWPFYCHQADSDQISSKFKSHKIRVWLLQFKEQSLSLALGEDLVPISRCWRPLKVVTGDSEVETPILNHYPIYLAPSLC